VIKNTILQIVPRVPGGIDGVGDYALTLAAKLRDRFGCATVFVSPDARSPSTVRGFEVLPVDQLAAASQQADRVILHYVNYGYQKRGVPFRLLSILRELRDQHRGPLLTIFHELYASGPPWSSAFWLKPVQIRLAKSVARLPDECIVSNENFVRELRWLVPNARVHLHPVPSGLEEPTLSRDQIANRDPHHWVIVGGTALSERSLRSLAGAIREIPSSITPRTLLVLGGHENPVTRSLLADLVRHWTDSPGRAIESDYRPGITAAEASQILRTCSFAWFNYFHRPDVETSVVLKSSAFASLCAHGVIPVFPYRGTPISLEGDRLPGPFFVSRNKNDVPGADHRAAIAQNIYDWYHRHVSSDLLVNGVAKVLCVSGAR
jgi:hypothetical protein